MDNTIDQGTRYPLLAFFCAILLTSACDSGTDDIEEAPYVSYSVSVALGANVELPERELLVVVSLGDRNGDLEDLIGGGQTSLHVENRASGGGVGVLPALFEFYGRGEPFSGRAMAILDVDDDGVLSPGDLYGTTPLNRRDFTGDELLYSLSDLMIVLDQTL